jgi:hypothetical protein
MQGVSTVMTSVISGYMLVFAIVQNGLLGFDMHALNLKSPDACQDAGEKIVKEARSEKTSVFYTCYNLQNMVPLTARVTASIQNGVVRFDSPARLYDSSPECVAAGNKFLKEADPNYNYACYELSVRDWPAFSEGYRPK